MLTSIVQKYKIYRQLLTLLAASILWIFKFMYFEMKRGTLAANLKGMFFSEKKGEIPEDMSWAELLEDMARKNPDKKFLLYKSEEYTYRQMNRNANRIANFLIKIGGGKGRGIGILMMNSPRFLDIFFGAQKIGMYVLLINSKLVGDGLAYVINNSDIEYLIVDAELLDKVNAISENIKNINNIIVNDCEEEGRPFVIPRNLLLLHYAYHVDSSYENPGLGYNKDDICLIMYTSGTTGPPKGVVYRYRSTNVKKLMIIAGFTLKKSDIYYTSLPLSHGNALFMTMTVSLAVAATVALARKFSASKFMDEIRRHNATVFNAVGTIIPILLKQPERPEDRMHHVRYVYSSGCPATMWEKFEKRFGTKIYESYGSIDSGGKGLANYGTAPVGSIGRPASFALGKFRIVDEDGNDVPVDAPGELIYQMGNSGSRFEYYKNQRAMDAKIRDGWLYTGDLVRKDKKGYIYFVGRNTESIRKGGINISAYEVESIVMKHADVESVAAYAVPSELSEDEVMVAIKPVEGRRPKPVDLIEFLRDKLPKYAIPRYVRFVDEFLMTDTCRIIKSSLAKEGITGDTFDAAMELKKAGSCS